MDANATSKLKEKVVQRLRELRKSAGKSARDAAVALGCHPSKISRLELGQARLQAADIGKLLDLYGLAGEERAALEKDAAATLLEPWWYRWRALLSRDEKRYLSLEAEADEIRVWASYEVPVLLQTPRYAGALRSVPGPRVPYPGALRALRQARQDLMRRDLARTPGRRLWAILDESVLLRKVGDPDIMREQVCALLSSAKEQNVIIQVVPLEAEPLSGAGLPFTILRFRDQQLPDAVWADTLAPPGGICTSREADVDRYGTARAQLLVKAEDAGNTPDILEGIMRRGWPAGRITRRPAPAGRA